MKLRRRRKEKEDENYGVRFHPARPRPEPPLSLPPPFIISLSPSTQLHQSAPSAAQLALRHGSGEQCLPAIPPPAVPLLPFLFHKITEATERGGRGTQLADPAVLSNDSMRAPSSPHPCPSRWPACPPPFSLSPVSRCGPSISSEAIGKQRPKMNYPVSSPSLTNK